jgi:hypothetical protein
MTGHYPNRRLMPRNDICLTAGLRLNLGDGFKELPSSPIWS